MANAEDSLSSLALSAFELKELNNWSDVMVEDYLTIIRNLSELASIIDTNAVEIIQRLDKIEQLNPSTKRLALKSLSLIAESNYKFNDHKDDVSQIIPKLTRGISRVESKVNNVTSQVLNYTSQKGLMLVATGIDLANPVVLDSYNVDSVLRNDLGVYRVTMKQDHMFNKNVFVASVHNVTYNIQQNATTDVFSVKLTYVTDGVFDIEVFEVTQGVGSGLTLTSYDLKNTDRISISLELTVGGYLPQE